MRRPVLAWAAGLVVIAAVAGWSAHRAAPPPAVAIEQALAQFIDGLETRRPAKVTAMMAPGFTFNRQPRATVVQGLVAWVQEHDPIRVSVVEQNITVARDRRHATAQLGLAISAFSNGREEAAGVDKPRRITIRFERHGWRWLAVGAEGDPLFGVKETLAARSRSPAAGSSSRAAATRGRFRSSPAARRRG